jgi:hypothetical protein
MTALGTRKARRRGRGLRPSRDSVDFAAINRAAMAVLPSFLARRLPGGRVKGREYLALNPRRQDQHVGSFKVNLRSGKWADFACGAGGRDLISLVAYLDDLSQIEAAKRLAATLGMGSGGRNVL